MYNNVEIHKGQKMGEKIAGWVWVFADSLGLLTSLITIINLDSIEKAILFCLTTTFLGYRIYHLHLDAKIKEIDRDDKKHDLNAKKNKK